MEKNNSLVPTHRVLTDSEKKALLEKYSLEDELKLPKIKTKDPELASVADVKPGDVIEIIRTSFAGTSKYYRTVLK